MLGHAGKHLKVELSPNCEQRQPTASTVMDMMLKGSPHKRPLRDRADRKNTEMYRNG